MDGDEKLSGDGSKNSPHGIGALPGRGTIQEGQNKSERVGQMVDGKNDGQGGEETPPFPLRNRKRRRERGD